MSARDLSLARLRENYLDLTIAIADADDDPDADREQVATLRALLADTERALRRRELRVVRHA